MREQSNNHSCAVRSLFVTAYANAKVWLAFGVTPRVMIGHSFGECVAATIAGVLSLESALALVVARGRFGSRLPRGGHDGRLFARSGACPATASRALWECRASTSQR